MKTLCCLVIIPVGWFILWLANLVAEKQKNGS